MAHRNALLALAAAPLAALALAACGGSSDPTAASSSATRQEAALKFSRCMREHGVKNFPDPEFSEGRSQLRVKAGPGGVEASPQVMEAAQKACQHYQEALAPKLTPQERVQREEALQKFAACMRKNGIHVETSSHGGATAIRIHGGPGTGKGGESAPNPEAPAFQKAQAECSKLLPGGGKGRFPHGPPPKNAPNPKRESEHTGGKQEAVQSLSLSPAG